MNADPEVSVRPIRPGDLDAVVDLLAGQDFTRGQPREALRLAFASPWTPHEPNEGVVLVTGDTIVGAMGLLLSTRNVDGRVHRFANATTWYVEPAYRRHSRLMLKTVMSKPDHALVVLSASPKTTLTLEKSGWEVLSRRRLFLGPFAGARTRGGEILEAGPDAARSLTDEHRRILQDHLPYPCRHWIVRERDRYCYLVTKRRFEKGWFLPRLLPEGLRGRRYPVSDILFVSDPALAIRHWRRLWWQMARRDRTVGATVEESFLGDLAPRAASTPHRIHVYNRRTDPRAIDALYSERVLLPH